MDLPRKGIVVLGKMKGEVVTITRCLNPRSGLYLANDWPTEYGENVDGNYVYLGTHFKWASSPIFSDEDYERLWV